MISLPYQSMPAPKRLSLLRTSIHAISLIHRTGATPLIFGTLRCQ